MAAPQSPAPPRSEAEFGGASPFDNPQMLLIVNKGCADGVTLLPLVAGCTVTCVCRAANCAVNCPTGTDCPLGTTQSEDSICAQDMGKVGIHCANAAVGQVRHALLSCQASYAFCAVHPKARTIVQHPS